jgi:hypothetical protein
VILVLVAACSVVQPGTDAFDSGTNTATVGNTGGTDATSGTSTGAGSVDTTGPASSSTSGDAESETGSESATSTSTSTHDDGSTTGDPTASDDGVEPTSPCCAPLAGGCGDAAIEACVCAEDDYCCDAWDIACAIEVEDFGCAECQQDDEVASCIALCTVFVECAPQLGFDSVQACLDGECLGLLDEGAGDGEACLEAMTRYNACIGLLDCISFDQYLEQQPPGTFPCAGFQADMFDACPFIGG